MTCSLLKTCSHYWIGHYLNLRQRYYLPLIYIPRELRQVPIVSGIFEPSDELYAEAVAALAAYEEAGEKAIRYKGRMLEAPLVKNYRAIVARKGDTAHA